MDRAEAIALLEAEHTFPGSFQFRVVVRPTHRDAVVSSMAQSVELPTHVAVVEERPSSKGTYLALRVTLPLTQAEEVLVVYASLNDHEGVLTSL